MTNFFYGLILGYNFFKVMIIIVYGLSLILPRNQQQRYYAHFINNNTKNRTV